METMNVANPFGAPVYRFGRVASTMDEARKLAAGGCPHGTAAVADSQASGRGRTSGRAWLAEPGESLLFTTVLRYPSLRDLPSALTLRVGLAAAAAIESAAPFPLGSVRVKWPNDVLSVRPESGRGKKLCGILCESDGSAVYVGVGINLTQRAFPPEIEDKAGSILMETGSETSRTGLLERFLSEFAAVLGVSDGGWRRLLEERLYLRGEVVRFEAGAADSGVVITGTLVGVGPGGELLIEPEGEAAPRAFASGELRVY